MALYCYVLYLLRLRGDQESFKLCFKQLYFFFKSSLSFPAIDGIFVLHWHQSQGVQLAIEAPDLLTIFSDSVVQLADEHRLYIW